MYIFSGVDTNKSQSMYIFCTCKTVFELSLPCYIFKHH